jgi:CubicO group peptidase (beta-lactamase class C family)
MKQTFIYFILTILFFNNIHGQNIHEIKIDSFINSTLHKFKEIPGLSIAVVKDGEPFYSKSFGYSNVENKIKATQQTSYYIASVTKSFVGLLAAKLHDDKRIDLDKPIVNYKPIKNFKNKSLFENITIRDLLSHTSGIRNDLFTWKFSSIGEYDYDSMSKLLDTKTRALYNNKFRYDNFGYNVFDLILKEEFGLSWKKLLETEIFSPLGMKHTSANISTAYKNEWSLAIPYAAINDDKLPKEVLTQKNDDTFQAAGGMISSSEDMQKFLQLYLNKGKLNGQRLFDEKVIDASLLPIAETNEGSDIFTSKGYGLGWNKGLFNDNDVYYHFGGFDGFFSHLSFLPNKNIGMAILTNESHFGDNISNLISAFIYDLILGNITSVSDYSNEVEKVENRVKNIQENYRIDREFRANNRKWTLMHDFNNYSGVYTNQHLGDLVISTDSKGNIYAKLGISEAIASPSLNDESIRVEFRNGRGNDILFISNSTGTMAAVYQGNVFLKQK